MNVTRAFACIPPRNTRRPGRCRGRAVEAARVVRLRPQSPQGLRAEAVEAARAARLMLPLEAGSSSGARLTSRKPLLKPSSRHAVRVEWEAGSSGLWNESR